MNNIKYATKNELVISDKSISITDESRLEWLDARYRLSIQKDEAILSPSQFEEYKNLVKKHSSKAPYTDLWDYYKNVLLKSYAKR